MTEASDEASTSALRLPSRKTYITALSSVAFITGITVATVVTVRRGRRMRMEELQSTARNIRHSETSLPARDPEVNGSIPVQGPLTLFKEMNRAAFGKKGASPQEEQAVTPPVLLRQRGKQVKASVFDSNTSSVAPSVLMKTTSKASKKEEVTQVIIQSEDLKGNSVNSEKPPEQDEGLMESPVLLAVKAIGIATALVGTGALITWEIAKRALGVQNADELIDRLAVMIPSRAKNRDSLSELGNAARKSLRSTLSDEEWEEEMARQTLLARTSPMSTDEALEALDVAAQKGEVATWVSVLSRQLDAEREQDIEQRRLRIARQRRGAVREQLSI